MKGKGGEKKVSLVSRYPKKHGETGPDGKKGRGGDARRRRETKGHEVKSIQGNTGTKSPECKIKLTAKQGRKQKDRARGPHIFVEGLEQLEAYMEKGGQKGGRRKKGGKKL